MVAEYCDVFAALLNNFLLMGKVLLKFVAAAAAAVFCVNGVAAANTVFSEDFATEDAFNKWLSLIHI